jgi:uncharacterized membrane protein
VPREPQHGAVGDERPAGASRARRITAAAARPGGLVWVAAVGYTALLSAASIERHAEFRSGGYDLGIFDQGLWLIAHGMRPFSTIRGRDLFADHFQPALVLFAPLGLDGLAPTGLLIVQSALLAAVAPALYILARRLEVAPWLALAVAVLWLVSPLTQWVNLFDFHPESAVPLLLVVAALELERGRTGGFLAAAAVASCFKEDVSLVFLGWGALLAFQGRHRLGALVAAASVAWFLVATQVAIPALGGSFEDYSARFGGDRGSSLVEVLVSFVQHPLDTVGDLVEPSNAKVLLALVLATGGLALLAPLRLLPAVPALAANFLSAYSYQHELRFHYYLIPAAVFAIAAAYGATVVARRGHSIARAAPPLLLAGAALALVVGPANEELRSSPAPQERTARERALSLIPAGAPTAAAPSLVPHLAHRRDVYQLPEPFFSRPTNGEYWTDAELRARARRTEWVVWELAGLDPVHRAQVRRLPRLLGLRGYDEVFRQGDVRVFRRAP